MSIEKKIMLIDENVLTLKIIQNMLKSRYNLKSYCNSLVALDELFKPNSNYNLVLIGETNSNANLIKITREIRHRKNTTNLPIVYMVENLENFGLSIDFFYYGGNSIIKDIRDRNKVFQKLNYLLK